MHQIHFIEHSALWALGLILAVIGFYLLRMPRQRLRLPSLVFLQMLKLESSRLPRRWRTILSMVLQGVLLLLLAFSAARPLLTSGKLENRRLVLVLDVSASMQARIPEENTTRFELAKQKARDIVRRMEHGDRMLIIACDNEARIIRQFEMDRRTLYRTLDALKPSARTTNLAPALELVKEVTRPFPEADVYLITDGASEPDSDACKDVLTKTHTIIVGSAAGNVGIVDFSSRRNLNSERDFSSVMVLLNTYEEPRKVSIKMSIDDTLVDAREVTLEPGEEHLEVFEGTLLVGGAFTAEVVLLEQDVVDIFPSDNVAYEWIPKPERMRVMVFAPEEDLGGYLDAAMSANIGVQGYRATPKDYNASYDVSAMIFYNWLPEKLPDRHLVMVNTRGQNPYVNIESGPVLRPLMNTWDRTHPLMNYIGLENLLLDEALSVKGTEWMEPVAHTVQSPIILAGKQGRWKHIFVAFDPKKSDFPFRLAFPVLLSNALLWFTTEDTAALTQISPGRPVTIPVPEDRRKDTNTITLVKPNGEKQTLAVVAGTATYTDTERLGVYRYQVGAREHGFGVNLASAAESNISCRPVFQEARENEPVNEEEAPALERELWFLLNWIALAIVCVEMFLYHRRVLF